MTKNLHLLAMGAAVAAVPVIAANETGAQQRPSVFGARSAPHHGGRFHGGHFKRHHFPTFILIERAPPVIVEREVVREVVREVPAAPPPPPRKPYVVGRQYSSLPGGCMKMIEGAASYYYCGGGEWYRLVGKQYRAVAKP